MKWLRAAYEKWKGRWERDIVAVLSGEQLSPARERALLSKLDEDAKLRAFARQAGQNLEMVGEAMGNPKRISIERWIIARRSWGDYKEEETVTEDSGRKGWFAWWPEVCGGLAGLVLLLIVLPLVIPDRTEVAEVFKGQAMAAPPPPSEIHVPESSAEVVHAPVDELVGRISMDARMGREVRRESLAVTAAPTAKPVASSAPVARGMHDASSVRSMSMSYAPKASSGSESQSSRMRSDIRAASGANYSDRDRDEKSKRSQELKTLSKGQMVSIAEDTYSTFSLNVSDVSYRLAQAQLANGQMPDRSLIRPEEFYNAFRYSDPAPGPKQPVAFFAETAQVPFIHGQQLLRFSVQTGGEGREGGRPLNLTLLIDNSGSMTRSDRQRILDALLESMGGVLQPQDRINLITFATHTSVHGLNVSPVEVARFRNQWQQMTPQGGTNLQLALENGYSLAKQNKREDAINRVLLITDGVTNLGEGDPEKLVSLVEQNKQQGIFFDVVGVGWDGYNDELLERLTRGGDGRYRFVNSVEEITPLLNALAGAFRPVAKNVKVQVEWNPNQVSRYRLIGYEQHRLNAEDFRNDQVDAAEISANEAGNALYLIERVPGGEGPLGTVRIRYQPAGGETVKELAWVIPEGMPQDLFGASPDLQLAACAAFFAEKLANPTQYPELTYHTLLGLLNRPKEFYSSSRQLDELSEMIHQAMRMD